MSRSAFVVIACITLALVTTPAHAKNNKVDVCHVEGNGSHHIINVSENAVNAHLAHGDWLVVDEVCGDGIDNDCDGYTDCCPCFTREDLDFYWPNNDPIWAFCEDRWFDNGNYEHYRLWGWGYEFENCDHQGFISAFAETWVSGGQDHYYCYWDAWYDDRTNGIGVDVEDYASMYTNADQYAVCDATLVEFFDDTGLECDVVNEP